MASLFDRIDSGKTKTKSSGLFSRIDAETDTKNRAQINKDATERGTALIAKAKEDKVKQAQFNERVYGETDKVKSTLSGNAPVEPKKVTLPAIDKIKETSEQLKAMNETSTRTAMATQKEAAKEKEDNYKSEPPIIRDIHKGLDKFADLTKPIADVAQEVYTPGAGLSVINAATKSAGALISKIAPKIGNGSGLLARTATRAAEEAITGVPLAVGNNLARNPEASNRELGLNALIGGAGGGVVGAAGPLIGAGLKQGLKPLVRGAVDASTDMSRAINDVSLENLPQSVRRVVSKDAVPEIFPERVRRSFGAPLTQEAPVNQTASIADSLPVNGASIVTEQPVRLSDLRANPESFPVTESPIPQPQGRGFAQTLISSDKTPQTFKERLKSAYTPITNEQTIATANKRVDKNIEEATSYVMGGSRFTAEKATTAQRLIDHYNKTGNFQRAVDVAEKVSEEATRAGQSIQALSMFNQLTPEGVLIKAQRLAAKTNESIPVWGKEVKVTPEMAEDIMGLAQASQKMTGVKDLANNIENILDKAKSGTKLSDTETAELKRFVNESKQFIKEVSSPVKAPRAPKMPKDARVKDNVVKFLDAQEEAAKARLRARGIRVSSTPLDTWADYAIIGAAKMGKGTIKFTEWSTQMVKDLGEDIKPHLQSLYERSRQTFEASSKKVTTQTISKAENIIEKAIKGNKNLSETEIKNMRDLAQKVSRLSGEEKNLASQDLQVIMQQLSNPTFLRKIATTQTIGQLLNPKTQVRNSLGNELFYRLERLNKVVATPLDIVRSKITGGQREVTFRTNNQGEYWSNWMRGLKAGWRGTNVNGIETQYDLGGLSFKSKYNPLTYLEKALGASLKSFDTAAYMRAYNNTIGEQATLRAINEGKKGNKELIAKYIREADDNIMKIADEYGKYSTFQDNNSISKALVALKKVLNLKKDFGMGDLILKYPKTPGALLHRALEYSPAGFVRSAAILSRPLLKKAPNTGEAMNALSRAIVGTAGLTGMGFFLLDKGVLTGAASKDKDIRDLQKSTGQGQYQVNLSALTRLVKSGFKVDSAKLEEDDFLYTYDWMQPLSMAISIGANTAKNLNAGDQKLSGLAGTAYNSLEGSLGTLTEQSVVQGLKKAAEGYPGQTITDKILDVLSDIPASFVPTFSNQIKQLRDNSKSETYDPSKLKQSLNRAQAKIPGLAQKLPIQYDTLGREKETYQDNSLFNVMFNPGFSSRYKLTPEEQYIIDLIEESGDESLAPRAPGKSITVKGEKYILDGDMYSRFQQLQGEETKKLIGKRMNNDIGKKLETRSKNISGALTDAGSKAKKTLLKELVK